MSAASTAGKLSEVYTWSGTLYFESSDSMRLADFALRTHALNLVGSLEGAGSSSDVAESLLDVNESMIPDSIAMPIVPGER